MNPRMKILIVDDNRDLVKSMQDIFEACAYDASAAHDGASAIELCRKESFHLGLIDIKLPDMDGFQLRERLAEMMDAVYIFITAHGAWEREAAKERDQVVGHEIKPLNFERLLGRIKEIENQLELK